MSVRAWMLVATLGLMLLPGLGQAQEQTQSPSGNAKTDDSAPNDDPFAIPVEIVESDGAAKTREGREAESRQHEIDDLVAQQGMNTATQEIKSATNDMRDYALYSTIIVFVGTLLLIWTLCETRAASRAAVAAVDVTREIGNKQIRAYLSIDTIQARIFSVDGGRMDMECKVVVRNSGHSPATNVALYYNAFIDGEEPNDILPTPCRLNDVGGGSASDPRKFRMFFGQGVGLGWDREKIDAAGSCIIFVGKLVYKTVVSDELEVINFRRSYWPNEPKIASDFWSMRWMTKAQEDHYGA